MSSSECKTVAQIVQGQDKELTVQILNQNGVTKDLTSVTFVQSAHPTSVEGQYLIKTSADALSPLEILGDNVTIKIPLSQANTLTLKPEPRATIYVSVDFPDADGGRQIFEIKDAYSVHKANFTFQPEP